VPPSHKVLKLIRSGKSIALIDSLNRVEEIVSIWESLGYEFVVQKSIDCDYHLLRGQKMHHLLSC
jgi:hypothetical protein